MAAVSVSEARDSLSEVVNRVAFKGERVVLQRHGKGVAVLGSMEDMDLLAALEGRLDLDEARKALKESDRKGSVAWTKVKSDLGL
jgi:prevent-host-death family protein